MERFYITYGASTHYYPYGGGWSVVEAPDRKTAIALFYALHPEKSYLCCYSEDDFNRTDMMKNGNYGKYAHEVIAVVKL